MAQNFRVVCPECKSESIRQANIMIVMIDVTGWGLDHNGMAVAEDFGDHHDATDSVEVADGMPEFQCTDCAHEFDRPKVIRG